MEVDRLLRKVDCFAKAINFARQLGVFGVLSRRKSKDMPTRDPPCGAEAARGEALHRELQSFRFVTQP